jgi:hypothetical protein
VGANIIAEAVITRDADMIMRIATITTTTKAVAAADTVTN